MTVEVYRRPGPEDDEPIGSDWILAGVFEDGEWVKGEDTYGSIGGDNLTEEDLLERFDGPQVVAVRPDEQDIP